MDARPQPREVAALDAYLVTASDHGMNASTFTARVVASTQADLFAAVTAGYCALTGPLHGGAPEPVLEMLDAIGSRERIKPWVDAALARGERMMGFGHRVYRVRDPRADVLKTAIEALAPATAPTCRLPARSRPISAQRCARRIRTGRWRPMSSSSPRSCSMRWRFRGRRSRRSSRWPAPPAGPRMRASSSGRGG